MFREGGRTLLVASDIDIALFQNLLVRSIPLSDQANRRYHSFPDSIGPEARRILGHLVEHDYSAATAVVNVRAALRVVEFASFHPHKLDACSARMIRLQDFGTDDNLILPNSPLSRLYGSYRKGAFRFYSTRCFQEHTGLRLTIPNLALSVG